MTNDLGPGFCGTCGGTFTTTAALNAHQMETGHEMDQPDHPLHAQTTAAVQAELTPQPWYYTTHDGTRLQIIPEGLRQDPGDGIVLVQVCPASHVQVTPDGPEFPLRTSEVPGLIAALTDRTWWTTGGGCDVLAVRPEGSKMRLAYTVYARDTTGRPADVDRTVLVPEEQRLPLASALSRALDVARSWES